MTSNNSRVAVALSGGMDSALAAAILKESGWDVHAVHFLIPSAGSGAEIRQERARMIARRLQIPFHVRDISEDFRAAIIRPFARDYLKGLTPNPCVRCNEDVKFFWLARVADEAGIVRLATGHYVRRGEPASVGPVFLLRGKDRTKEQSYFLHRVSQAFLQRALFPLGEWKKALVREQVRKMGLSAHTAPESREICFLDGQDYRALIEARKNGTFWETGNIVDRSGELLGVHRGVHRYTIGQRRGLGIASSRPYYVMEIRPGANEVVVGRREELYERSVEAEGFHWTSGAPREREIRASAQVRYRNWPSPGKLEEISRTRVRFVFDEPQWALTPGQALVCYDGDRVLGGGWILRKQEGCAGEPAAP